MFFNLLTTNYERYRIAHLVMGLIIALYSLLGAFCFCALEQENALKMIREREHNQLVAKQLAREKLFSDLTYYFFKDIKVAALLNTSLPKILDQYDQGLLDSLPVRDSRYSDQPRWNLWGGLYYSGSLYTTIGYGDLTTKSVGGRLFTILYSFLGIPLLITVLNTWGGGLFECMQGLYKKYLLRSAHYIRSRARKSKKLQAEVEYDDYSLAESEVASQADVPLEQEIEQPKLPMKLAVFAIVIYLLFSSFLFQWIQGDWDFITALYFSSVSLTTIGLGDVVVPHRIAVLNFVLILLGLAVVSMSIQIFQVHIEAVFARIIRSIESDFKKQLIAEKRKVSNATSMYAQTDRKQSATVISIPVPSLREQEEFRRQSSQSLANATPEELDAVHRYATQMSLPDRFLVKLMSKHQKRLLNERFLERTRMRNKAIQTDERKSSTSAQTDHIRRLDSLVPAAARFNVSVSPSTESSSSEDEAAASSSTKPAGASASGKAATPQRKRGLSRKKLYIYAAGD
ncbi:hypothetical protein M3Y99_01753700 [Aphelenchoides fujianensis]|nr:hypothetical protein M3Y99_01753700 [Aphelenchoides fujianensis]